MTATTKEILDRIEALPEEEREATSKGVLKYMDKLTELRTKLREGEEDIAAGRMSPIDEVAARILNKPYGS